MPYIGNVLTSFAVETGNIADQAVTAPKLSATGGTNGQVLGLDAGGNLVWTSDPAGQWVTSGSDIYFDGGNVGIGTTSPASLLTVDGVGAFGAGSASAPSVSFNGDLNTGIYSPGADQVAISTNGTGRLEINSAGVISHKLYDRWEQNDGTSVAGYLGNANAVLASGNQADFGIRSQANIVFAAGGGTERMRLDSSGRLGLGTSSPDSKLHVVDANLNGIRIGYLSGSSNLNLYDADAHAFRGRGSGDVMRITSSGNVGIGTTSPSMPLEVDAASASGNDIVRFTGKNSGNIVIRNATADEVIIHTGTNDALVFGTNGNNERARIDSSGRLLVGTSSARSNFYNGSTDSPAFQIEGTGSNDSHASIVRNQGGEGSTLILGCSGGTSLGSNTLVSNGDRIGHINFQATDGAEFVQAANIKAEVDGTPGANDMPGRLVFSTTADGASSPTERMRIGQAGYAKFSNTGAYFGVSSSYHERNNNAADWIAIDRNSNGTPFGVLFEFDSDPNGTGNQFWRCRGAANTRAELRSNGGIANFSANNVNLSDRNVKKDISPAADTWHCLKEWEIVNFRYKDQPDDADLNLGVIAQQVAESCPEVITVFQEATEDQPEKLGVKDQQMMWMAIKALQEAQLRIETLEAEVAALKGA